PTVGGGAGRPARSRARAKDGGRGDSRSGARLLARCPTPRSRARPNPGPRARRGTARHRSPSAVSVERVGGVASYLWQSMRRGGLSAAAAVGVAVAVFGAPASSAPAGLLAVAFGLLVAVVLFFGLAALTAAALLVIRQAGALTTLGSMAMPLVAGAYFPIGSLPQPLEAISAVLPFRAAVELIRGGLLHGSFLTAPAVELCARTPVFVGVALF